MLGDPHHSQASIYQGRAVAQPHTQSRWSMSSLCRPSALQLSLLLARTVPLSSFSKTQTHIWRCTVCAFSNTQVLFVCLFFFPSNINLLDFKLNILFWKLKATHRCCRTTHTLFPFQLPQVCDPIFFSNLCLTLCPGSFIMFQL